MMSENSDQTLWLIYDGDCPLCSSTAKALKIRKAVGTLLIINAREPHPVVEEIHQAGLDLNTGMVLKFNDTLYHGADALNVLAMIGTQNDWFNRCNVLLFRSKFLTKLFYPVFKAIRNLTLKFKNITPIHHSEQSIDKIQPIFQSIFGKQWQSLPEVMHKHYANRPYSHDITKLEGKMNIYYSGVMALFIPLLKLFGTLVPYQGKNIPVTIHYRSHPNSAAFYYDRTFYFPEKEPYHFRSYMIQIKNNDVVEFMHFGIGWRMLYLYDGEKIILQHKNYVWKIFHWLIPLPISLLLGKCHVEEKAISDDSFRMDMTITHPLFGKLFEYQGEFNLLDSAQGD